MKHLLAAALLLAAVSQVGCATIFTGSSDRVTIETDPPGASCVVIGGTVGTLLVKASEINSVAQKIFKIIDPHLSAEARNLVRKVNIHELITALVMCVKLDTLPAGIAESAHDVIARIPRAVLKEVLEVIGVQDFGAAPMSLTLKKGHPYAVIAWADGYTARLEVIDVSFNFVTLLNFLNFFLGVPIDMLTGAWLNFEEEKFRIRLRKR